MIDLRALQADFDLFAKKLARKKVDAILIESLKNQAKEVKSIKQELENLQARHNADSKLFGQLMREKKDVNELKITIESNKEKIAKLLDQVREKELLLEDIALKTPNIADEDVPYGDDENSNVELKRVLEPKKFSFKPKEHWELGENLGWIDFERGVKVAKSRFSVLKKDAARLERALINYMLDFNRNRGFEEVCIPFMVNQNSLKGTGQLPKFEEDLFKIENESLYLIPTSEVPLTNLYADEILSNDSLPIMMSAYSACFRKEAGSAGRDTRGMIRQHQFDKVELVAITHPDESEAMLEKMVSCASDLLTSLGLPHRHMLLCDGDLGFGAAKTIDLEVWLPGQNTYREISSISNTRDFQARRAQIRIKNTQGKNILANTLNGSSLAVGRTLVAIMENYQNEDGSISIPEVLKSYIK